MLPQLRAYTLHDARKKHAQHRKKNHLPIHEQRHRIDAVLPGKHLMQDHFRIRQRIGAEEHPANHYNQRRIDVIQSPEAVLLQ